MSSKITLQSTLTAAVLALAPLLICGGEASAAILFADNFNRADSTNLNASSAGKSGTLGALNWTEKTINGTVSISGNRMLIDSSGSVGQDGGIAWVDHNFTGLTAFTVSVVMAGTSGGEGRFSTLGIGQSLAELNALTSSSGNATADVAFGWDVIGANTGITIFEGGMAQSTVAAGTVSSPDIISAVFTFADMNAGTTLNYELFLNAVSVATGSTTWSATNENYISLSSNYNSNAFMDDFSVENVPEPGSLTLLGMGGLGFLAFLRRRRG